MLSTKPSKPKTPKKDFSFYLKEEKKLGKNVLSDRKKTSGRVVEFDDGTKLRLLVTGEMVLDYPNGKKVQRNADGTGITIEANGTKIQENPNGNVVVQQMDGTTVTHVASGSKIYVYPDGSSKQVDLDGSGVIIGKDGTRTDFTYGGDARFEAERLANDKRPLDESEENLEHLINPLGSMKNGFGKIGNMTNGGFGKIGNMTNGGLGKIGNMTNGGLGKVTGGIGSVTGGGLGKVTGGIGSVTGGVGDGLGKTKRCFGDGKDRVCEKCCIM